MSILDVEPIRDRRPFKCEPHLDYQWTANQSTSYNMRTPTIGKLHVSIVDDQIKPILLRPTSIPIQKVRIGEKLK